jgi:hypothetical protein
VCLYGRDDEGCKVGGRTIRKREERRGHALDAEFKGRYVLRSKRVKNKHQMITSSALTQRGVNVLHCLVRGGCVSIKMGASRASFMVSQLPLRERSAALSFRFNKRSQRPPTETTDKPYGSFLPCVQTNPAKHVPTTTKIPK